MIFSSRRFFFFHFLSALESVLFFIGIELRFSFVFIVLVIYVSVNIARLALAVFIS